MATILEMPVLLGISTSDFPESVWVLHDEQNDKYFCLDDDDEGIRGMVCFVEKQLAEAAQKKSKVASLYSIEEKTFDDACDLAKERPMPVIALFIIDRTDFSYTIHYVK